MLHLFEVKESTLIIFNSAWEIYLFSYIYAIIYIYRFMDVYFILQVIIQYYFILLLRLFQLWPLGAFSFGPCIPFAFPQHGGLFLPQSQNLPFLQGAWFLGARNQDVGVRCVFAYWDAVTSIYIYFNVCFLFLQVDQRLNLPHLRPVKSTFLRVGLGHQCIVKVSQVTFNVQPQKQLQPLKPLRIKAANMRSRYLITVCWH